MITVGRPVITLLVATVLAGAPSPACAQDRVDPLLAGFTDPPREARPRTWWHWTGGNVTREGITKDLEWMKRIGLAGFQLADVAFPGSQTVDRKIQFGPPEWYDMVLHAAQEANRLGLEMGIFSSPGWSLTGGPWVKPEQAMKKLVWSETNVTGPCHFHAQLPMPPTNNGPIRNLARGGRGAAADLTFYADTAVIAFRTPPDELCSAGLVHVGSGVYPHPGPPRTEPRLPRLNSMEGRAPSRPQSPRQEPGLQAHIEASPPKNLPQMNGRATSQPHSPNPDPAGTASTETRTRPNPARTEPRPPILIAAHTEVRPPGFGSHGGSPSMKKPMEGCASPQPMEGRALSRAQSPVLDPTDAARTEARPPSDLARTEARPPRDPSDGCSASRPEIESRNDGTAQNPWMYGSGPIPPNASSSSGPIDPTLLLDNDLNTSVTIRPATNGGPAWIQYEFDTPRIVRALTLAGPGRGIPTGRVLVGNDLTNLRLLLSLPGPQQYRAGTVRTFAFEPITAKVFRIEFTGAPLDPATTMSQAPPAPAQQYALSEFVLHAAGRVHRAEEKAGFSFLYDYESVPTPPVPETSVVPRTGVLDLTAKMAPDGTLEWDVPPGNWTIMRFGYSLTGAKNRPATPEATGYEVDKLSKKHLEAYFRGYFGPLEQALGPLFGTTLKHVVMDSWEAGMQNWTDEMLAEFKQRRGYDPTPYLPALAGRIVGSAEITDRFLWDFRRTLADMFAENHYGAMSELLSRKGIELYAEAAGVSMEIPEDTLLNKSKVTVPMCEFWLGKMHPDIMYYVDARGAASAAHVYGKQFVAAEAFTGGGYEAPYTMKKAVDYWFAQGVNQIVFHTCAHQPLDTAPGNTMVGTHFNRNITWAELAGPFITYLARVSFMLQQGLHVADIAYLLPEGAPSSQPFWGPGLQPPPPPGYDYDCINADVLLSRANVSADGNLVLTYGISYRVLALPQSRLMTPRLLRKLRELVAGGLVIVGPKPVASPSLEGYPDCDAEVRGLAAELWGDLDGVSRNWHYFGKGVMVWNWAMGDVLARMGVAKDFEYAAPLGVELAWTHRRTTNADIYFVANRSDKPAQVTASFRVSGKAPELWRPDTGQTEPIGYSTSGHRTIVELELERGEAVFVVFRNATTNLTFNLPSRSWTVLATLDGAWTVTFPTNLGGPGQVEFATLESWTTHTNDGIKYFSGTATYEKSFMVPADWFQTGQRIRLDLGEVRDIAEVFVNDRPAGLLWKPPYVTDVTDVMKPGPNRIKVKVTNQWTNRLLGDRIVQPERRVLRAPTGVGPGPAPRGQQEPPASGLLGPVRLIAAAGQ